MSLICNLSRASRCNPESARSYPEHSRTNPENFGILRVQGANLRVQGIILSIQGRILRTLSSGIHVACIVSFFIFFFCDHLCAPELQGAILRMQGFFPEHSRTNPEKLRILCVQGVILRMQGIILSIQGCILRIQSSGIQVACIVSFCLSSPPHVQNTLPLHR